MRVSDAGLRFIAGHEISLPANGVIPDKYLRPYNDPSQFATIAIGHLIARRPVNEADRAQWGVLTQQQAFDLFRQDIKKFEDAVNAGVKVPITQNAFNSLVSFSFNVGIGAFQKSTLLRKLNAGDYKGAAGEFAKWNKSAGRVLAGLTRRRKEEAELFLRSDPGGAATIEIPKPTSQPVNRVELQRGPSSKFNRAEWLHPEFKRRLESLYDVVPFTVTSGGRSTHRQAELYRLFKQGRGNPANPPGTSWHEYNPESDDPWTLAQAADIEPKAGFTDADLHREGKQFGLWFPIRKEPWHLQPWPETESSRRTVGQGLGPLPEVEEEVNEEEDMIKYGLITPQGGGPIFGVFVVPEEMELSDGQVLEPGMVAKIGFTNGNILEALVEGGYVRTGQKLIQLSPDEWERIPHVGNV